MTRGLSHVTFISGNPDRTKRILEQVLDARGIYKSGDDTLSLSRERFFMVGDVRVAVMQGAPLPSRSDNHIAFAVAEDEIDDRVARIAALGMDLRPPCAPCARVPGEGQSICAYRPENCLIELHSGSLEARLARDAQGRNVENQAGGDHG